MGRLNFKMVKEGYTDIHRDIVEQSKFGNSKAQYQLYQLYAKAMFNICCRMMNNQTEAEDMLQEAFCEAFINLENFRFESSFGAWLKRIVINKCINALKKKKADLVYVENLSYFDDSEEPYDESKLEMDVERVKRAVDRLPDGYRVIFSLYLLEGYDHVEISEILGISESTSKSQYMRAKRKVKELLMMN